MSAVLGIDSSTQSVKAEVRDLATGEVLGRASARHPAVAPPRSEQHPDAWWLALVAAVNALEPNVRSRVTAMAVAGQQHGLVLLDSSDQVLRPAMLWNDTRSAPQAEAMVRATGAQQWLDGCGSVPVASFTISKLVWVAENEPALLDGVARVLLPHDELTRRLTGRAVTDRGDASGSGWFDPNTNEWRPEAIDGLHDRLSADWLSARLPELVPHGAAVGRVLPDVAEQLGLPQRVVVEVGTGDNMAAAAGLGVGAGDAVISLGTSGTAYTVADSSSFVPHPEIAGFAAAVGDRLPLVCTLNATRVTDTVAGWFGLDAVDFAVLALTGDPDRVGPVIVPWFDGERSPNRPTATGSAFGLTNECTRADVARSIHDGVLCGLLEGLDLLRSGGLGGAGEAAALGSIRLVGGGAQSVAYRQRLADLVGHEILVPTTDEAVATGAALLAATALDGTAPAAIADAWGLANGQVVEPRATTGPAIRSAYREAIPTNR